ncbi:hypothetical protein HR45_13245 [Shewanella mangrovi]|uniref:Lipoprotein n=1 Tax=Shewanella mangrovi TaxID=1515746 RepID=A0A094JAS3_9GAMM|nr:hypothetical protein [Shewanella mangrovi]KFZ37005.1 hypothetical protein HR45_13245 [Shewanella mangrovi]
MINRIVFIMLASLLFTGCSTFGEAAYSSIEYDQEIAHRQAIANGDYAPKDTHVTKKQTQNAVANGIREVLDNLGDIIIGEDE